MLCLQTPAVAKGFLISVHKWLTVIRLLLGEIPTRAEFDLPGMHGHLHPYLALTAAVRSGDVTAFNAVAAEHEVVFQTDRTHNLINRLRYNVLRAGLRRISVAYSRISLQVRRFLWTVGCLCLLPVFFWPGQMLLKTVGCLAAASACAGRTLNRTHQNLYTLFVCLWGCLCGWTVCDSFPGVGCAVCC